MTGPINTTANVNKKRKVWTQDDDQLLRERFQSCTIEELAACIGCCHSTLCKHARKLGLWKENPFCRNHEARELVRMEYDNLSYPELAKRTGLSRTSIYNIVRELGLSRTPEQLAANKSKGMKNTWSMERARATFGLDQKTKLKVFSNTKKRNFRANIRRCGYIVVKGDNVIYYTESLVRRPKRERTGMALGLEFKPWPAQCAEET